MQIKLLRVLEDPVLIFEYSIIQYYIHTHADQVPRSTGGAFFYI